MLMRPVILLGRYPRMALALSVAASFFVPDVSDVLAGYLPHIIVVVLTIAFLRSDIARLIGQWRRPDRLALMTAVIIVVAPFVAHAVLTAASVPQDLLLPVMIMAAAPPLGSSAHFALYLRLDAETALNLVIAGTLATPFVAPLILFGALDLPFDVDPLAMMARLGLAIALAIALAEILRAAVGRKRIADEAALLDGIAVAGMIAFLFGIMAGVPDMILTRPDEVIRLLVAAIGAGIGFQLSVLAIAIAVARARGRPLTETAATVALLAGNRNMGLFLTAIPAGIASTITPFIALYQIPMYLTPLLMAPVYGWALRRSTRPESG